MIFIAFFIMLSLIGCEGSKQQVDSATVNIPKKEASSVVTPTPEPNPTQQKELQPTATQTPSTNPIQTLIPTQIPAPEHETGDKSSVLEAYKAVLQNKLKFVSTDNKKEVYLNNFLAIEEAGVTLKILHFTILDMDGDNIPEVVLELGKAEYPDYYEVLHYMNGSVYGYIQGVRGFENPKTDGTFKWANSADNTGYGKLRFESDASENDVLGYRDSIFDGNKTYTDTFFIKNKPATEEEYNSFSKEENRKKDVVWYDFSQKNIETVLSSQYSNELKTTSVGENVSSIQNLVPKGWHILEKSKGQPIQAIGDLNNDGIDDVAIVIEGEKSKQNDVPPRALLIAFGKGINHYSLSLIAEKAILKADEGGVLLLKDKVQLLTGLPVRI
jgi:hypothetical protein